MPFPSSPHETDIYVLGANKWQYSAAGTWVTYTGSEDGTRPDYSTVTFPGSPSPGDTCYVSSGGGVATSAVGTYADNYYGGGGSHYYWEYHGSGYTAGAPWVFYYHAAPYVAYSVAVDGVLSLPAIAQAISGVSSTIPITATTVRLTGSTNYTLTSTPTIADGVTGQVLRIINVGSGTFTLQDETASGLSTNLKLGSSSVALATGDTLELQWSPTLGKWAQIATSVGGGGSGITALTGDATASGTGSVAATVVSASGDFDVTGATTLNGELMLPSIAQAISGASSTIPITAASVRLTGSTSYTLTSAPTIADGASGQVIRIINVGSGTFTLQDEDMSGIATNLQLSALQVSLEPGQTIELQWSGTVLKWCQVSAAAVPLGFTAGGARSYATDPGDTKLGFWAEVDLSVTADPNSYGVTPMPNGSKGPGAIFQIEGTIRQSVAATSPYAGGMGVGFQNFINYETDAAYPGAMLTNNFGFVNEPTYTADTNYAAWRNEFDTSYAYSDVAGYWDLPVFTTRNNGAQAANGVIYSGFETGAQMYDGTLLGKRYGVWVRDPKAADYTTVSTAIDVSAFAGAGTLTVASTSAFASSGTATVQCAAAYSTVSTQVDVAAFTGIATDVITVASGTAFPSSGEITVVTGNGIARVKYGSKTGNDLKSCLMTQGPGIVRGGVGGGSGAVAAVGAKVYTDGVARLTYTGKTATTLTGCTYVTGPGSGAYAWVGAAVSAGNDGILLKQVGLRITELASSVSADAILYGGTTDDDAGYRFRVNSNGTVLVRAEDDALGGVYDGRSYGAYGAALLLRHAGGTRLAPTYVPKGDQLAHVTAYGWTGSAWSGNRLFSAIATADFNGTPAAYVSIWETLAGSEAEAFRTGTVPGAVTTSLASTGSGPVINFWQGGVPGTKAQTASADPIGAIDYYGSTSAASNPFAAATRGRFGLFATEAHTATGQGTQFRFYVTQGTTTTLTEVAKITYAAGGSPTMRIPSITVGDGSTTIPSAGTEAFNVTGTSKLTGAATFGSTITGGATSDIAVNTNKFTVTASSGNTLVGGTLDATGNFAINTNKFTVSASSGDTLIAGVGTVTGNLIASTLIAGSTSASGNLVVQSTTGSPRGLIKLKDRTIIGESVNAVDASSGSAVMSITSAATNDDPTETVYQFRSQTTDAAAKNIGQIDLTAGSLMFVEATVICHRTTTSEVGGAWKVMGGYRDTGSAVPGLIAGSVTSAYSAASSTQTCTLAVSGTSVAIQVVGVAAQTYTWHATVRVYSVDT